LAILKVDQHLVLIRFGETRIHIQTSLVKVETPELLGNTYSRNIKE